MTDDKRKGERRQAGRRKGEKLPYLPWYIDEWDSSRFVQRLSIEGQGLFLLLLKEQWRDGSIPAEEVDVRAVLGLPATGYGELSSIITRQFVLRGHVRVNSKLATLRRKAVGKVKKARELANVRWQKERNAKALPRQKNGNAIEVNGNNTKTGDALYDGDRDGPGMAAIQAEVWGQGRGKR